MTIYRLLSGFIYPQSSRSVMFGLKEFLNIIGYMVCVYRSIGRQMDGESSTFLSLLAFIILHVWRKTTWQYRNH